MIRKLLVEQDPHESRIALLEDDRVTEVLIERHRFRGLVGNIYKGRVTRVLPGMQAAFVDIGLERDAFLYVSDAGTGEEDGGFGATGGDEEAREDGGTREMPSIDDLLKAGQEALVQVRKEPLPAKGARVTAQLTLPSRYLVLVLGTRHLGVSRRIEDEEERERLRQLLEDLRPAGHGLIARTEAEGRSREDLEADLDFLTRLQRDIERRWGQARVPSLVHRDLGLTLRAVRDLFGEDTSLLWVHGEDAYEEIVEFLGETQPDLLDRVKLDSHDDGLFVRLGVEKEIEGALESKVWLRSGGYLVINPTEALVAIDVNTGRFVGRDSLEETIFQTNMEAVSEIARQIRLRDLGGIIVIDLIDMEDEAHRDAVFRSLEEQLRRDRAHTRVLNISEFGLVELTRKRSRADLASMLSRSCPHCRGRGWIKSVSTVCLELRRHVLARSSGAPVRRELLLRVHPDVAGALQGEEKAILDEIEDLCGKVLLQSDPELHHERFDILDL